MKVLNDLQLEVLRFEKKNDQKNILEKEKKEKEKQKIIEEMQKIKEHWLKTVKDIGEEIA